MTLIMQNKILNFKKKSFLNIKTVFIVLLQFIVLLLLYCVKVQPG